MRPYSWQADVFGCWELWVSIMRDKHLEAQMELQARAQQWAEYCFGDDALNHLERGTRAVEEAVELAQAFYVPKETLHRLVDAVYAKPVGNVYDEIGDLGFMAMCIAQMMQADLSSLVEGRLVSAQARTDEIRIKHMGKVRAISA